MGVAVIEHVVLRDYPVRLGQAQAEHTSEVMREFQLLSRGERSGELDVPRRLVEMAQAFTTRYAVELDEPERMRDQALEQGVDRIDLVYPVRPETLAVAHTWRDMMREVDAFCEHGDLLTLRSPEPLIALREWVIDEFVRQIAGEEPQPWDGPLSYDDDGGDPDSAAAVRRPVG